MQRAHLLVGLACLIFLPLRVTAQLASTTSLVGTVTDSSGAAVANAKVVAVNSGTRYSYHGISNGQGDYSFLFVHEGTYEITASANGFATTTHSSVVILNNQTVRVNFALPVGAESQTVTVTDTPPPISTDDPSLSQTIDNQQASTLPLNGRDPLKLGITTPGVVLGLKSNIPSAPGEDFIGAGAREVSNDISLDGVSIMDNLITNVNFKPSLDAVDEVQIETGTYPAQYGGYLGVHMNMTTKSGTNELHGTAFEYVRNDLFDGRNFFQAASTAKIPYRRNQFGAELGGPVMIPKLYSGKDKTFFMVDYEGLRQVESIPTLGTVLTNRMRAGDFSELSTPISDPLLPGDPTFPGNVIPQQYQSPQAIALLNFLPSPTGPGLSNNLNTSVASNDSWDQTVNRIDENISDKTRLFFRIAYFTDSPFYGSVNPYSALPGPNTDLNFVVGYTQILNSEMVNDFRIGRQLVGVVSGDIFSGNQALMSQAQSIGIPGFQPATTSLYLEGVPTASISGYTAIASGDPTVLHDSTFQVNDTFSYSHGAHNIMAGFDLAKIRVNRTAVNDPLGAFTFTGQLSGSAPADFILGLPQSDTTPEPAFEGDFGEWRNDAFVLDKWNLTHRLTLNLGLRYEIPSAIKTINGNATLLNANNTALIPGNAPVPGFVLIYPIWTAVAPRVGFAYRATNNWVVRGGVGIYYNPNHLNDVTLLDSNPPFSPSFNYQNSNFSSPSVTLANPEPSTAAAPAPPTNVVTLGQDRHIKIERMNQWSLDVERSLWKDAGLDVQYLGKYSYDLDGSYYINTPLPGPGAVQTRRPNQLWGSIRNINNHEAANYNAMNVVMTQRLNHGATLLVSYVWAHSLDEGPDSNSTQPMDPYDLHLDYSSSNWDIRSRFVADFSYAIPFFHDARNTFARYALGGWSVNGIVTAQTGMPFNVTIPGDVANIGITGVQRPNVVGTPSEDCGTSHLTGCIASSPFANPAAYTFGDASRNILNGPGYENFDGSIFKEFPIHERAHFQFRAEFFNAFNTPSFAEPNAVYGTSAFGTLTSTSNNNREIQFAGKINF